MTNSQGHQGGTGTWIAELPKPFELLLFVVCERARWLTNPLSCYFIPIGLFAVDEHGVFQRYKICSYPHWIWAIHGCTVYLCTIGRQEIIAIWHAYVFKLCCVWATMGSQRVTFPPFEAVDMLTQLVVIFRCSPCWQWLVASFHAIRGAYRCY